MYFYVFINFLWTNVLFMLVTLVFSVGNYRRELYKSQATHEFFGPNNAEGLAMRE